MQGSKSAKTDKPTSAERVPVINSAAMLNPTENVNRKTEDFSFARVNSSMEKGMVQTKNSAKKFLFTKVDAGLGPCAKN